VFEYSIIEKCVKTFISVLREERLLEVGIFERNRYTFRVAEICIFHITVNKLRMFKVGIGKVRIVKVAGREICMAGVGTHEIGVD